MNSSEEVYSCEQQVIEVNNGNTNSRRKECFGGMNQKKEIYRIGQNYYFFSETDCLCEIIKKYFSFRDDNSTSTMSTMTFI